MPLFPEVSYLGNELIIDIICFSLDILREQLFEENYYIILTKIFNFLPVQSRGRTGIDDPGTLFSVEAAILTECLAAILMKFSRCRLVKARGICD